MSDYTTLDDIDSGQEDGSFSRFSRNAPYIKAALIFAVPFIIIDFFNYYTAGTASIVSLPVLLLLYTGCGALSAKFAHDQGYEQVFLAGALSGAFLWIISTVVNTIVAIIIGTFSLFTTLLLGIPYLCICAPVMLVGGGIAGGIGGFLFNFFFNK